MGVENGSNFDVAGLDAEKLEGQMNDDTIGYDYADFLETVHGAQEAEGEDPEAQAPTQEDLERAMSGIDEEDFGKLMDGNTHGGLDGFLDRVHEGAESSDTLATYSELKTEELRERMDDVWVQVKQEKDNGNFTTGTMEKLALFLGDVNVFNNRYRDSTFSPYDGLDKVLNNYYESQR